MKAPKFQNHAPTEPARKTTVSAAAWALLGLALLVHIFLLCRLHQDWWFEDDTMHVFFVTQHDRPWTYFFDRETMHAFSFGRTVTPMLTLTFWVDWVLAPLSPAFAYGHSLLVQMIAAALLLAVLARFTSEGAALAATVLWLFLPSSISVFEFLATRHYVEGLIFSLLAVLAALRGVEARDRWRELGWAALAALAYLAAACAKEVFVASALWLLFWLFAAARRFAGAAVMAAAGAAYFGYRLWAVGLMGQGFDSSWGFADRYHLFLERFPYMLTGNNGGYAVLALAAAIVILAAVNGRVRWAHAAFWLTSLLIALASVFPVTEHLTYGFRKLGTWYRVIFVVNTLLAALAAWAAARTSWRWPGWALAALAAASIGVGGWRAAGNWDASKALYRADAEFYIANPDKLLYTVLPAPWFMLGVHRLYGDGNPWHYLHWRATEGEVDNRYRQWEVVWRRGEDGVYRPDPELYDRIRRNVEAGVVPLHK